MYLKLVDSDNVFTRKVLGAICTQLNIILLRVQKEILDDIIAIITVIIDECPEMGSLRTGKLRKELGIIKPEYFISALLKAISGDIYIEFIKLQPSGKNIVGGLNIGIITGDYSKLLTITEASYNSGSYEIPWLRWLLTEGTNILIANFQIVYGTGKGFKGSRTGGVLMKPGGSYSIPSQFAGTLTDNFITRALYRNEEKIMSVIQDKIEAAI